MECEKCKGKTRVYCTYHIKTGEIVRKRECLNCGHRFTTHELTPKEYDRLKAPWRSYAAVSKIVDDMMRSIEYHNERLQREISSRRL